jgi:hypothetical protein
LDPSIGNISSVEMREIYELQEREKLCVCRQTIRTLAFLPPTGTICAKEGRCFLLYGPGKRVGLPAGGFLRITILYVVGTTT